jgi:hypothetical protein
VPFDGNLSHTPPLEHALVNHEVEHFALDINLQGDGAVADQRSLAVPARFPSPGSGRWIVRTDQLGRPKICGATSTGEM